MDDYYPKHRHRSIFHLHRHRRHRSWDEDYGDSYGRRDNLPQNIGAYAGNANAGAYGYSDNIIPASNYATRGGRTGTYEDVQFRDARCYEGDVLHNMGDGSYRRSGEMTRGTGGYSGDNSMVRLDGHGDVVSDGYGGYGGGGGRMSSFGGEGGGMEKSTVMDNIRRGHGHGSGGDYRSYGGGYYGGGNMVGGLDGEGYGSVRENSENYDGVRLVSAHGGNSGVDEYRREELQAAAAKHRHLF